MKMLTRLFGSSLGQKYVMAISGGVLLLFVVAHLLGNAQIFLPDDGEAINAYGHFLQSKPGLVYTARAGLLAMVLLHIWSAVRLSAANRAARGKQGYEGNPLPVAATYASRTMLMSGLIVAAFIVYHLLHFTAMVPSVNLTGQDFEKLLDAKGRHDVYRMMVIGFQKPLVAGFYVVAMSLLCLHLSHGVQAAFQSLGLKSPVYRRGLEELARALSWALFIGYVSIPFAILFGLLR
jgi:succinate dehydrogenase / fumarate reductase, cytochrome b subunit